MKKIIHLIFLFSLVFARGNSQITLPVIKANFGVDADLRANYFNGAVLDGNDDWFKLPGTTGTGEFIIDTAGAAAIVSRYGSNIASRRTSFARTMRFPAYSIINNSVMLDAVMVRDFHGNDSTVFASGSNKNGDNPLVWSTPESQGIPDKNDILDMMVHIRRAGSNSTDSLWMIGGLSLDNTNGNRYFDFEMYQTDLAYNRAALSFTGVGPDAGHTSWNFDASGNIIKAGDIIFSAEYQSASLTSIEARIWVHVSKLSITPAAFDWSGQFNGSSSGAQYGYASIRPKAAGTYYTGLQSADNTWGGPFSIILQDDAMVTNYQEKQFVEFSVNLTKLGLDPLTRLGGDACGAPFQRILVKTRASASFTAELKDFVAPFAFFNVPITNIATETPFICKQGSVAQINVTNPLSTSSYVWTTTNGNIISGNTGTSITVDTPGTYIVTQHLLTGCSAYSADTIQVMLFTPCAVLSAGLTAFKGVQREAGTELSWKAANSPVIEYFEIERSLDGVKFGVTGRLNKPMYADELTTYKYNDSWSELAGSRIFYRVKLITTAGTVKYSSIISFNNNGTNSLKVYPNPARDVVNIQVTTTSDTKLKLNIVDHLGKNLFTSTVLLQKGANTIALDELANKPAGIYFALIYIGNELLRKEIILMK